MGKTPRLTGTDRPIERPVKQGLGSIYIRNFKMLPEIFRELGGNPDGLLRDCGIDPRGFIDKSGDGTQDYISFSAMLNLLAVAAKQVNCPHFGLIIGHRLETSLLDPVSFLLLHSPTIEEALNKLIQFIHIRIIGLGVDVSSRNGIAQVSFNLQIPGATGSVQILDMAMASFVGFMRFACGPTWCPNFVLLSHQAPENTSPYRELFGIPVRFDQKIDAMLFPASYLKAPVANANPSIGNALQIYVNQIEAPYKDNIISQTRRAILALLPSGKCTIDHVTDILLVHRRTLHRRLLSEGLTFEQLVDETRRELAIQALTGSDMSPSDLASALGYRDTSAFSRAFRRWTGISPMGWRKQYNQREITRDTPST